MGFKSSNRKLFVVLCLICAALMVLALTGYTCDEEDSYNMQDTETVSLTTEEIVEQTKEIINTGDGVMHIALEEYHDWLEGANNIINSLESAYNDETLRDEHLRIMQEGTEDILKDIEASRAQIKSLLVETYDIYEGGNKFLRDNYHRPLGSLKEGSITAMKQYLLSITSLIRFYDGALERTIEFLEYTYTLLGNPNFCPQRGPEDWNIRYQEYMRDMNRCSRHIAAWGRVAEEAREAINNGDTGE